MNEPVNPPPANPGDRLKSITMQVHLDLEKHQVMVQGPIHMRALCISALADAIKIVCQHQPTAIVKPTNGKTQH